MYMYTQNPGIMKYHGAILEIHHLRSYRTIFKCMRNISKILSKFMFPSRDGPILVSAVSRGQDCY